LEVKPWVAENGSFDFAEGLILCVGAKANVPFVWWIIIFILFMQQKFFFHSVVGFVFLQ
jgi:hypothetical protein